MLFTHKATLGINQYVQIQNSKNSKYLNLEINQKYSLDLHSTVFQRPSSTNRNSNLRNYLELVKQTDQLILGLQFTRRGLRRKCKVNRKLLDQLIKLEITLQDFKGIILDVPDAINA